jgi:hypothetical protein
MQRDPARRSHLLTVMLLSLVAVGAMCVFVISTSGLHIQTEFLELHLGPDNGDQAANRDSPNEDAQIDVSNASGEDSTSDEALIPLDLVDKATDLVDEIACPTNSICLSSVVKDSGLGETVDDLTDGLTGSSLGEPVGEAVDDTLGDALDAETLGDSVDEVVGDIEETADDLLDEVDDVVEDLVDEVEDVVDDVLGGLGLGN